MTTVAYRNGALAADRQYGNDGVVEGETTKIFRRESDGALIGCCGTSSICKRFQRWFLDGEQGEAPSLKGDDLHSAGGFIIRPDGRIELHDYFGCVPVSGAFFAIGSGKDFALGAMEAGASAAEAVEIAARRDAHTGCGVDVLYLVPAGVVPARPVALVKEE